MEQQKGSMVYLAGPIDLAAQDSAEATWREILKDKIRGLNISVGTYDPMAPFRVFGHTDFGDCAEFIYNVNMEALRNADLVVAWMPAAVQSLGTPVEAHEARQAGTPLIVVTDLQPGVSVFMDYFCAGAVRIPYHRDDVEGTCCTVAASIAQQLAAQAASSREADYDWEGVMSV